MAGLLYTCWVIVEEVTLKFTSRQSQHNRQAELDVMVVSQHTSSDSITIGNNSK